MISLIFGMAFAFFAFYLLFLTVRIVPQQEAFVVERLGKYHATLNAGMHVLLPFVDRVAYRHSLKEFVHEIPEQACITKDNVMVHVDGILFYRVMDAKSTSYGIGDYNLALTQLAQTTLRSEIGKIELDRTFEEREKINHCVINAIDRASEPWGVKVLRYEIKSITPPRDVLAAMEKQMRAEREKRALILESEGDRDAKINRAEGVKQEVIKASEAQKQRQINEAQGEAEAILSIAAANAKGIEQVARTLGSAGGNEAAKLKLAEQYIQQFGNIAKTTNTIVVPANLTDIGGAIATVAKIFSVVSSKE
jgi:regulator of protease activity HflC (stomatin/prohibitin superfamily)